jgi:hypothetical protein
MPVRTVSIPITSRVSSRRNCYETITTTLYNITDNSTVTTTETKNICGPVDPLALGLGLGLGLGIPALILLLCLVYKKYRDYQTDILLGQGGVRRVGLPSWTAGAQVDAMPRPLTTIPSPKFVDLRKMLKNQAYLDAVNGRLSESLKSELLTYKAKGGSMEELIRAVERIDNPSLSEWLKQQEGTSV